MANAANPSINVQHDWDLDLDREGDCSFFINSFSPNREEFGTVSFNTSTLSESSPLSCDNPAFAVSLIKNERCLNVSCKSTGATTWIHAPAHRFPNPFSDRHLSCIDCTSVPFQSPSTNNLHQALCVSASSRTGDIKLFDPTSAQSVIDLSGHRGGTHACKFFPSGKLVLSGGSDLRLKIWTVAEGALAAEFCGHSGGITSVAIVGRGRSVLSSSRDGSAKLWNSGSQQCIQTFNMELSESAGVANQCKVFGQENDDATSILCAFESGAVCAFDARSSKSSFAHRRSDSLIAANAVSVSLQPDVFAVGYQDGLIRLVDCRNASTPLASFSRGSSAVIDILSLSSTLISSCHDGATTEWSLDGQLIREFSASDCEPVSALSCFQLDDSMFLMSAADDGIIRKYKL